MNKNYYTEDYYINERAKYLSKYLDRDLYETLLSEYATFCGIAFDETKSFKIPAAVFFTMSFGWVGKTLYDFCKIHEIDNKQDNDMGLTKPLKLRRIKEYK